jgi:hypothetical protein
MNILIITVSSGKEPRLHNGTQQILDLAVSIGKLHDLTMSMSKISLLSNTSQSCILEPA